MISSMDDEIIPNPEDERAIFDFELSILPSSSNELAAALSEEDGDVPPAMETACELVHSLLDQVAWNDAPPTNDDMPSSPTAKSLKSPKTVSTQCHVTPSISPAKVGAFPKEDHGEDPSDLWDVHYNRRNNPSEKKMGNVAFATLCSRTLETVGKSSKPTNEFTAKPTSASSNNIMKTTNPQRWKRTKSQKNHGWLRRGSNNKKKTKISQTAPEDAARLQMFGSEYARYLSTTPLAPKEAAPRVPTISRATLSRNKRQQIRRVQLLEQADLAVLTGAITDIVVTAGEEVPPKGYFRVSQSAGGSPFHLKDRKGALYINVKKEKNWDRSAQRPCVTALALIFPERKEFVPPGFSVVRKYSSVPAIGTERAPANLNLGDEPVYMCFRRSREGNPITGLVPLQPSKRESVPEGYTVMEKTPRNHVATIQTATSQVFLAYRQRLANLEPLRPLPLVMSVHNNSHKAPVLTSYYCTGGTVVQSRVGRFHLMDRSTHSLLSLSSMSNRLSMIEASRRKTLNSISDLPSTDLNTYAYSNDQESRCPTGSEVIASSVLMANGIGSLAGSNSVFSDFEKMSMSSQSDVTSVTSSSQDFPRNATSMDRDFPKSISESYSSATSMDDDSVFGAPPLTVPPQAQSSTLFSDDGKELQRCLGALSFIPLVSTAVNENDPREILQFQARVAILTPILTACYTRHGGSALLAVEGLSQLLNDGFFSNDIYMEHSTSSRLSLLDIVVQVGCDVATMGTQETHLQACVDLVSAAVKYGCGYLNTRTVGYVLRLYLFVFYFGVSIPNSSGPTAAWSTDKCTDHFLLQDPRTQTSSYLPGGAPQSALLSMKELVSFSIARLRSLVNVDRMSQYAADVFDASERKDGFGIFTDFVDGLLSGIVDESVHRVDIANYTQLAMHQICRSGGSELFWYDMLTTCGTGLFGTDPILRAETKHMYSMCFALLANCVKVASSQVRRDKQLEGVPRDVASKLMSLEMILFFLRTWEQDNDKMKVKGSHSLVTFAFCVRRLVVPCLLSNTKESIEDPRIYRRVLRIIGCLWCSPVYRRHMKLEIGILMEQFVLKVLKLGPQILYKEKPKSDQDLIYLFAQQIELMKELKIWFGADASNLLELFLNFDGESQLCYSDSSAELLSRVSLPTTQNICALLCSLSESCSEFLVAQIKDSQEVNGAEVDMAAVESLNGVSGTTLARESAQRLRKFAVETLTQIIHCLAIASASIRGDELLSFVEDWTIHSLDQPDEKSSDLGQQVDEPSSEPESSSNAVLGFWRQAMDEKYDDEAKRDFESSHCVVESDPTDHMTVAFHIAKEKSVRKAMNYLVACGVLTPSPRDIASFLRLHREGFRPKALGQFLGEGGSDGSETEHWNLIRFNYVRALSFGGMTVEKGLRHLLTNGGFRLPGEAQQVDRLITTFAQCYWEDNVGDVINCPFHDQDAVFLLSFAIIMLNTDLHKSSPVSTSRQKKTQIKKMTKAEFLSNLKGAMNGDEETYQLYLSDVYDSIENRPIVLHDEDTSDFQPGDHGSFLHSLGSMTDNAKSADALLRGLSVHEHRFFAIKDHAHHLGAETRAACIDLTHRLFGKIWHHFHGLINSCIESAHLDLKGLEGCSLLLQYALCLTICLDMNLERCAFLDQLGRFRVFQDMRFGESILEAQNQEVYKGEAWFQSLEALSSSVDKTDKLNSLKQIHQLMGTFSATDANADKGDHSRLRDAVRQLQNGDFLLNDPNRSFVREGNLMKRANRSGRCAEYRFFLFSDMLIYSKKVPGSSHYKIHEELPLIQMKVIDWFPPEKQKEAKVGFQVFHPRKKFMVFCADAEERMTWVAAIKEALAKELERKVAMEQARKVAGKIH